jgi:fatty acid desaturase
MSASRAPSPSGPSFDVSRVDLPAFLADVQALRAEADASLCEADGKHLRRIERWGRLATAVGLATAWVFPNPVSVVGLTLGRSTRWLLMHHVGHRGYDRVPGVEATRKSKGFAHGWRRFLDWPDWMLPEAWKYEHNVLHHSHTGEEADPDLLERNAAKLQRLPMPLRWVMLAVLALTWRASYYAPETLEVWRKQRQALAKPGDAPLPPAWQELLLRSYLPYVLWHFVALPALFLPLGTWAAVSALCNSLLAELLTNLHTFLVVGPNHTGEDLYRFDTAPKGKAERYLFQVLGSVNYRTGGDVTDYAHLWLNYQIEHHLFPDLPMSTYRAIQPKVRALCERHGIPYVQESVWTRARKMADVVVGRRTMKRYAPAVAPAATPAVA